MTAPQRPVRPGADPAAPLRWSQVFIRRRPNVFKVRGQYEYSLPWGRVRGLAVNSESQQRLMAGTTTAWVFLDGGLTVIEKEWPEAYDSDVFADGIWVVGTAALRAVCDVLDLVPPRRLATEAHVPTPDEVRADLAAHRTLLTPAKQARHLDTYYSARSLAQLTAQGTPLRQH